MKYLGKKYRGKAFRKKITTKGGIIPVFRKILDSGVISTIDTTLGKRADQAKYSYSDVFISWTLTAICGGRSLYHIENFRDDLSIIPNLNVPSHDTIGRVMKKLSTPTILKNLPTQRDVTDNYCNINYSMSNMLIAASKKIGALKENVPYTLDIDATFINTCCAEAKLSNSSGKSRTRGENTRSGFNPMVCLIGDKPVYISMRNGNTNAEFEINQCLKECLDLLDKHRIKIDRVISDGAGYNIALTHELHSRGLIFNIHAPVNPMFKSMWRSVDLATWSEARIRVGHGFIRNCEMTEIPYNMTGSTTTFRMIVARIPDEKYKETLLTNEEKHQNKINELKLQRLKSKHKLKSENKNYEPGEWKLYNNYRYKLIITNDFISTREQLLLEYNKRGDAERKFSFLKNDFAWKLPPFSNMNENTVFMIAASLANNIYRAILTSFSGLIKRIRTNMTLRTFQTIFIEVGCFRERSYFIFANKPGIRYDKLLE